MIYDNDLIKSSLISMREFLIDLRRDIHKHPELRF